MARREARQHGNGTWEAQSATSIIPQQRRRGLLPIGGLRGRESDPK